MSYNKHHNMKCLKCKKTWKTKPSTILQKNSGCPNCISFQNNKIEKGKLRFEKEMKKHNKYEQLSDYKLSASKVEIKCKKCGIVFYRSPKEIYRRGLKCKCYVDSKAVIKMIDCLDSFKIKYTREYTGSKLKNKNGNLLKYDFFIPKLKILIEIDGHQHFDAKKFDGRYYNQQIENDKIKNYKSKYPLIRISHSESGRVNKILKWIEYEIKQII